MINKEMVFLSEIPLARFRKLGAKDKMKRRRRNTALAVLGGLTGGALLGGGMSLKLAKSFPKLTKKQKINIEEARIANQDTKQMMLDYKKINQGTKRAYIATSVALGGVIGAPTGLATIAQHRWLESQKLKGQQNRSRR